MIRRHVAAASVLFDGSAIAEPSGAWDYELDDYGVEYYGDSQWPFYRRVHKEMQPTSVRLSPNTEFKLWRTQYVLLTVLPEQGIIDVGLKVLVHREGSGGWVAEAGGVIDLESHRWIITRAVPDEIKQQSVLKRDKVLSFLAQARAERAAGCSVPLTAYERSMLSSDSRVH